MDVSAHCVAGRTCSVFTTCRGIFKSTYGSDVHEHEHAQNVGTEMGDGAQVDLDVEVDVEVSSSMLTTPPTPKLSGVMRDYDIISNCLSFLSSFGFSLCCRNVVLFVGFHWFTTQYQLPRQFAFFDDLIYREVLNTIICHQ